MSTVDAGGGAPGRLVLAWVDWYTRDLPERVARQRRQELASDVWEQANDPRPGPGGLLGRALRGAPADLVWRRRALHDAPDRPPLHLRWERSGLLAVVTAEAALLLALLAAALVKASVGGAAGVLGPTADGVAAGLLAGIAAVTGALALLPRAGARWLSPLLLTAAVAVLLRIAAPAVVQVSTTVAAVAYGSPFMQAPPTWSDVGLAVLAVAALFHLAVAAAWLPQRHRRAA